MQLIHLGNICKKGWGGYSKPSDELDEMVKNGLLTKEDGPFDDVVYRPTNKGRGCINSNRIAMSNLGKRENNPHIQRKERIVLTKGIVLGNHSLIIES